MLEGYSSLYLVRYSGYAASRNYGEQVTPTSTPQHHGPHTSAEDAPAACKHQRKQPPNMWTTMLVWTIAVVLLPAPRAVSLIFYSFLSSSSISQFTIDSVTWNLERKKFWKYSLKREEVYLGAKCEIGQNLNTAISFSFSHCSRKMVGGFVEIFLFIFRGVRRLLYNALQNSFLNARRSVLQPSPSEISRTSTFRPRNCSFRTILETAILQCNCCMSHICHIYVTKSNNSSPKFGWRKMIKIH